jgi:hypothetical protein
MDTQGEEDHPSGSPEEVGMYAPRRTDLRTPQGRHGHPHHPHHPQRKNIRPIPPMRASRASDKGFSMVSGRPRKKPWEQKAFIAVRLEQETYQRIRRLAQRKKCSVGQAVELLIRTQESEKIEPTMPVDYSHLLTKKNGYTVYQLLEQ